MLSQFTKFAIVNNSGQLLSFAAGGRINLKVTGWFITPSTGKVDYTTLADDDCGFDGTDTLADGAEILSGEISNTSTLFLGFIAQLEITHDEGTLADGTFDVYMLTGDATGELESDASGYDSSELGLLSLVGGLTWHASGVDDELMRSRRIVV